MKDVKSRKRQTFLPNSVHVDDIQAATDEELRRHFEALTASRSNVASRGNVDLVPWELEICYVQRELDIRADRFDRHQAYLQRLEDDNERLREEEIKLPVADLDNMEFVLAWLTCKGMN